MTFEELRQAYELLKLLVDKLEDRVKKLENPGPVIGLVSGIVPGFDT